MKQAEIKSRDFESEYNAHCSKLVDDIDAELLQIRERAKELKKLKKTIVKSGRMKSKNVGNQEQQTEKEA